MKCSSRTGRWESESAHVWSDTCVCCLYIWLIGEAGGEGVGKGGGWGAVVRVGGWREWREVLRLKQWLLIICVVLAENEKSACVVLAEVFFSWFCARGTRRST